MLYVFMYLISIVLANLSLYYFGYIMLYINAFLFIGLDLTARDKLHDAWKNNGLVWKMTLLILTGSILSYLFNKEVLDIAIASFVAFGLSAIVDTFVYQKLQNYKKLFQINGSNVFSSLTDSLVFPTLAFHSLDLRVSLLQFLVKFLGGLFWSLILQRKNK